MNLKKNIVLMLFILIILSIFNLSFIYTKLLLKPKIVGYASDARINLTILSYVSINLTNSVIDFGNGQLNEGVSNATLFTNGNNSASILRGNWTDSPNTRAFVLKNIGNVNCSVYIKTSKNASDFFNSLSNTNQEYKMNFSNKEAGSCTALSNNGHQNQWTNVVKDPGQLLVCNNFGFYENQNSIYIDILLTVPFDYQNTGTLDDTITISAQAS
jgi:hypothetical protein